MAGRRIGADPRLHRAAAAGRIGGDRGHRARAEHQARLRRPARAGAARAARGGCARAAGQGHRGPDRRPRARPHRRGDARQSACSARSAAELERGEAGRRLRASRPDGPPAPARGSLSPARRRAAWRDAATAAARRGGADRRRDPRLARGSRSRDREELARPGGRRAAGRGGSSCPVPASAGAVRGVPGGGRLRAAGCAPGAGRGDRSGYRSRSPCMAPCSRGDGCRRGGGGRARALRRTGARPWWRRPRLRRSSRARRS
jgi:hypothetical protein